MSVPRSRYDPGAPVQQELTVHRLNQYVHEELEKVSDAMLAYPANVAILQGAPDPFPLQNSPRAPLVNYGAFYEGGGFRGLTNDAAGSITLPVGGLYKVSAFLIGQQQSATQNEGSLLHLEVNGANTRIGLFPVATNKLSRQFFSSVFSAGFNGGDVLVLSMNATTSAMGTFTPEQCSFEVELTDF